MSINELSPKTIEYLAEKSKSRARRRAVTVLFSAAIVFAIGAGAYFGHGVWEKYQVEQKRKREEALAAELVKDFRPESFEKAQQAIESGQVSREQIWEARRAEFERMEKERMDAYFALPVDQRDAFLDKLIDEMQQRMQEFQRQRERDNRRPQTRPTTEPTTEPTTQPGERRQRSTPEERAQRQQQRMDTQAPADRARRAEFHAAMMKRMQERGMGFGRGRGGGRGGPGR